VKEMTLLLFSFQHTSLLTVHTDLHGHTASRDAPSSGISLFKAKSNQLVLNLANMKGGRAQSLFFGPETA
jgi:hypothetical protein